MKKLIIIGLLICSVAEAKTPTVFNVKVNKKSLNQTEYVTLKADRVNKVKNMKSKPLTFEEALDWIDIASLELQGCPVQIKKGQNIIELINSKIETGICMD